jgi:hypothetical protein
VTPPKPLSRREIVLARAAAVAKSNETFVFGSDVRDWLNAMLIWDAVDLAEDVRKVGAVLLIDGRNYGVESLAKFAQRKKRWPVRITPPR